MCCGPVEAPVWVQAMRFVTHDATDVGLAQLQVSFVGHNDQLWLHHCAYTNHSLIAGTVQVTLLSVSTVLSAQHCQCSTKKYVWHSL